MGCEYEPVEINRHGTNVFQEFKLYRYYKNMFKKVQPDIVFSYTIKPNIYGAFAAKKFNIPFVANITGLGTAVETPGLMQKITTTLYKHSFSNVQTIFFQNKENQEFFEKFNISVDKHKMLPGSGVNLERFHLQPYPTTDSGIEFVFISRIMKEKGIEQYLDAAEFIKNKYPSTMFHICGYLEDHYEQILKDYEQRGIIQYHGMINDIREILMHTHCTVHPTYYPEGLSNVLIESAASGRPIISTDRSGTRETIDDEINGYLIEEKNSKDLIMKIEKFINLPNNEKKQMGLNGRKKVEKEFDREIVVESYLKEVKIASSKEKIRK